MQRGHAPTIGIVGGIASGKSLVAGQLERLGAAVVSADLLAHEVLKYDEVKRQARERWGSEIFTAEGEIDRPALAKIVFAPGPNGPRERTILEQWTHPEIGRLARQRVATLNQDKAVPAIVLDVPLMFESGWNKFCDKIVFVDTPREQRMARALARGWTREEFERREAVQQSPEAKRELADVVIDNSGSTWQTQAQVERFWRLLEKPSASDETAD